MSKRSSSRKTKRTRRAPQRAAASTAHAVTGSSADPLLGRLLDLQARNPHRAAAIIALILQRPFGPLRNNAATRQWLAQRTLEFAGAA